MALNGLGCVNVELTSRCNKKCWMCGRRKVDKDYPELALKYGDMDFELVKKIAAQLPANIVVQFHKDGEALLYPRFVMQQECGFLPRPITERSIRPL